jgi:hypothetical protein
MDEGDRVTLPKEVIESRRTILDAVDAYKMIDDDSGCLGTCPRCDCRGLVVELHGPGALLTCDNCTQEQIVAFLGWRIERVTA